MVITIIAGYFILFFNFFIAPVPRNIILAGWWIIGISALSSFFTLKPLLAIGVTLFALPIPLLITWRGSAHKKEAIKQQKETQELEKAVEEEHNKLAFFIGQKGIAFTDLKPCGNVNIIVEVKSKSGFISKDTPIVVANFENGQLVVEAQK